VLALAQDDNLVQMEGDNLLDADETWLGGAIRRGENIGGGEFENEA
jgi:hypothetical protein